MKIINLSIILITATLFYSCEKNHAKIEIKFDNKTQNGWVVFDTKDSVSLDGDTAITYESYIGTHTYKLNNDTQCVFKLNENGGLLNLSESYIVRTSMDYGEDKEQLFETIMPGFLNNILIIDSTIYIYNSDANHKVSDDDYAMALFKNKNGYESNFKLYKNRGFIEKDWDYGLNEEFPEEISVKASSIKDYSNTKRTKIIDYNLFLILTALDDNFSKRDIRTIKPNGNELKEDSLKSKKQLEF